MITEFAGLLNKLRAEVNKYKEEAANEKKKQRSLRRTMQRIVRAAKNEESITIRVKVNYLLIYFKGEIE